LVHLYIEADGGARVEDVRECIRGNLRRLDADYDQLEAVWNLDPLRVTFIPLGSFEAYYEVRQREGADLAHLKPPHMNPSDQVLDVLLASRARQLETTPA
jgi:hypothetical protein